jgi:hypothetical protein
VGLMKQREIELNLPHFCQTMGYDRANLLRPCTPAQVEVIRKTGFDAKYIKAFSNQFGLALVLLGNRTFYFPPKTINKGTPEERDIQKSYKIIESFDHPSYKVKHGVATSVKFTLSEELMEENRYEYRTIRPAEYLSLRTAGGEKRTVGHPDDQARRMYLRLIAKRQWWDRLVGKGLATATSGNDNYEELVEAAGLRPRNSKGIAYDPEKKIAYQLKLLLKRVGALPSISLVPKVLLNQRTGKYEVSWTRLPLAEKPSAVEAPAPQLLSMALATSAPERRRRGRPAKQRPAPAAPQAPKPILAKPVYVAPVSKEHEKLREDLTYKSRGLNEFRGPEMVEYYQVTFPDQPGLHAQHVQDRRQEIKAIEDRLRELGSKIAEMK